ncbi:MAG: PEP-CTERM sorting domain-containing protein [Coleofasciculus sp. G1-WW12-02]|uniref:PEP-CTERM sorting domain-containing protein n=1 Tax=Coleofasciculus sp. G1-WW12-02 TaxID=3068483 RepID=UPI003303A24F
MVNSKIVFPLVAFAVLTTGINANAATVTGDFEDVAPFSSLPVTTQGIDFSNNQSPNIVLNVPDSGAQNTTGNYLAWCGSICGGVQVVTASFGGQLFDALSLDAANLQAAGVPLGFVPGMTLEVVGNVFGGGTVSQSLTLVEDTVTTFNLNGFTNLISLDFFAPSVDIGGETFNPDPLIDNLVIEETQPVPEPLTILGSATALGFGGLLKRQQAKKQKKADKTS